MEKLKLLVSDKRVLLVIKVVAILVISILAFRNLFRDGIENYQSEKTYSYQNDFDADSVQNVDFSSTVEQQFLSKGNILSSICVYISAINDQNLNLTVEIVDSKDKVVGSKSLSASELLIEDWNTISMDISGLKRGETYAVELREEGGETGVVSFIDTNTVDIPYLGLCTVDGQEITGRLAIGISQVYNYFDLAHGMYLGINIIFLAVLLVIVATSILSCEEGIAAIKAQGFNRYSLYAALMTMSFIMMFNPMDSINTEVQKFSRVMGSGLMSGYDVTRVISNFTSWILAVSGLYTVFAIFMARVRTKDYSDEQRNAWDFLDKFMVIAAANLIFRCITYFYNGGEKFYYSSWLVILISLAVLGYIFCRVDKAVSFRQYQDTIMLMYAVSIPIAILLDSQWQNGMLLLCIQFLLIIIATVVLKFVVPIIFIYRKKYSLVWAGTFVASLFPMMLSLYIETVNVLAGKGIFITRMRYNYAKTVLAMFVIAVLLFAALNKCKKELPDVKIFAYPFSIVGISMLSQQIPLTATYSSDLFEGANAGILISDFLNFGDIPILQHYGGHMMTAVWEGILYGLVNNDNVGAVFSPYSGLVVPIIALAFYYFLKEMIGEDIAFWTALIFPFYGSISYWGLGLLIPFAIVKFIQRNSYFRAIMLWLACLWVTLYRLDMGYAFDIACVMSLLCYIIYEKKWKAIRQLGITLACYGVLCGGLWCIFCLIKHINPITRLLEFVKISASNQNWAYASIGNVSYTMYAWCYVIAPLFISVSLVYVILSRKFRSKAGLIRWIFLITVGTSYFANFSRGLVRHSLAETSLTIVLWTAYLYMAILISCYIKKELFILVFTGFILFNTLLKQDTVFTETGLADAATIKITSFRNTWTLTRFDKEDADAATSPKTYWCQLQEAGEKVERVVIDTSLQKRVKPLEQLCELLLEDDETYIDYLNRTLTYCLLQKENPVYVSQSPLQLSGDYTQECFIDEIAENPDENPIVIMPNYNNNDHAGSSLDGLANNYRYYRVAEYLYQNYVPLCHNDEFAVWCLASRYDDMAGKLADYVSGNDCIEAIKNSEIKYGTNSLEVTSDEQALTLAYTGTDPILSELQNYMDLTPYIGANVKITISYKSDVLGVMQIFYTETEGESYVADKVVSYEMTEKKGVATFVIPVTEFTRLRLDTPEESTVKIISMKYGSTIELVDYGYDRYEHVTESATYIDDSQSLHQYSINRLALIWAEMDEDNAISNTVLSEPVKTGTYWEIENADSIDKTEGNYLSFRLSYAGTDSEGYTDTDDETLAVTVRIGTMDDDKFVELYRYSLTAVEGEHDYLVRVSGDYYWYLSGTDTISIECDSQIKVKNVKILQGD